MDLRKKTLIILTLLFLSMLGGFLVLSYTTLTSSYQAAEEAAVRDDLIRVHYVLENEVNAIDRIARDWGPWDETYVFVQDRNDAYIQNNLDGVTIQNLGVSFMIFADQEGTIVYGKAIDPETGRDTSIPPDLLAGITAAGTLTGFETLDASEKGFLVVDGRIVLIASHPITTSTWDAPPAGALLCGKFIDERELEYLGALSGSNFTVMPAVSAHLPGKEIILYQQEDTPGRFWIFPENESFVIGTMYIDDVTGTIPLFLQVFQSRDIYLQGRAVYLSFTLFFLLIGIIFISAILLIIDRFILSRIVSMTNWMEQRDTGDPCSPDRILIQGTDEISILATTINDLLAGICESTRQIAASEEKLRLFVENFPGLAYVKNGAGRFVLVSRQFTELAGLPEQSLLGRTHSEVWPGNAWAASADTADREAQKLEPGRHAYSEYEDTHAGVPAMYGAFRFPIRREGRDDLVGAIILDITERRREQDALGKARERLSVLETMTMRDIRSHLFTLTAYLELARAQNRDESIIHFLEATADEACHIDRYLIFSRHYQDLGTRPPRWQRVDEVFLFALSHIDTKGITREGSFDLVSLYADPLLERALTILVQRIITHTGSPALLTLSTGETPDGLTLSLTGIRHAGDTFPQERPDSEDTLSLVDYDMVLARDILAITGMTFTEQEGQNAGFTVVITAPRGVYRFTPG